MVAGPGALRLRVFFLPEMRVATVAKPAIIRRDYLHFLTTGAAVKKSSLILSLAFTLSLSACGKPKWKIEAERAAAAASATAAAEAASAAAEEREAKVSLQQSQAKAAEAKLANEAKIAALRANVASMMKDPASVTFQNLRIATDNSTLCGEVNAKNGFGGYVGFRPFFATTDKVMIRGSDKTSSFEESKMTLDYLLASKDVRCE